MRKQSPLIDKLWLALTAMLVLGLGCNRVCEAECTDEGLCNLRTYRAGDALYRCYARTDVDCQDSRVCREEGRCFSTEQGTCVVATEVASNACATSTWCSRWGMCGQRDGVCWADSDADCQASFECRTIGRCGARGGVCIPLNDAHCQESLGCEIEGLCQRSSYLGLGYDCRVPLDDATACEQAWVCEHYGRCAPALTANCDGCRYGFCAEPGSPAVLACSPAAAVTPACSADGRCAPNANYECAHAPVGMADTMPVAEVGDIATGADKPDALPPEATKPETPWVRPQEGSTNGANLGNPQADLASAEPSGPGAVAFALDPLAERNFDGLLTYATVLMGASGFQAEPVDFLVLRATPEDGCTPRSGSAFLPLGAIWLMGALPEGEGTFSFDGGPMPGQMSAKTWLWTGDQNSGSHNLAMHGTIAIISRSATEVRGNVDFRVTEYFSNISIGTVRGPFVANVADCSTHTGGWPM